MASFREEFPEETVFPITDHQGTLRWYNKDNILHREAGPASIHTDGSQFWYVNGEFHREDGPAIETPNGPQWYFHGIRHKIDDWLAKSKLSDAEKVLLKVRYG